MVTTDIHGSMRYVSCVCKEAGEALPTTFANVFGLARDGSELIHKNATMSVRRTDSGAQLEKLMAFGHTMRGPIPAEEDRIKALNTLLAD